MVVEISYEELDDDLCASLLRYKFVTKMVLAFLQTVNSIAS